MDTISQLLDTAAEKIDANDFTAAAAAMQDFVTAHPEAADERFLSEFRLLNRLIEYKSDLKDWDYFRSMKLVYRYLESQYVPRLPDRYHERTLTDTDTIWWCWLQGYDAAPEVVKCCYASLKKLGKKITILDQDNLSDYVELPEYILSKWKNGVISNAHFSDLLRLSLLTERGGSWIDATVYCSDAGDISELLDHYPLFCYSFAMRDSVSDWMLCDNWLLHASAPSTILEDTRSLLFNFWKEEDNAIHYFLFHLAFSIACRRHPEEYAAIPVYSLEPCHILQLEMLRPYEERRFNQLLRMSGIHKLTHKFDADAGLKGSMLEHLLKQN